MTMSTKLTGRAALTLFGIAAALFAAPQPSQAEAINAVFNCDGGLTLNVVFDNDKDPALAVVTIEGEEPQTLPIAMSGSGYAYSNGKYGLRGKGDEAMWEVGKMAPINCKQAD